MDKTPILRTKEKAWLFGLCSGLDKSLGINMWVTRSVFTILALAGGFGIILYIVLTLLIQKEITPKRFLGVFAYLSKKYDLEITRVRLVGGFLLFFGVHYGLLIYLLMFLCFWTQKSFLDKKEPDDNNQD